jgi:hypothetical protein
LTIRRVAGQGIKISNGIECEAAFCTIDETGAGGILSQGSRLILRENQVRNIGRIYPSAIGVSCSGTDNRVFGNFIENTPYTGLTCDGFGTVIEGNRIQNVMEELRDGAGIYLGGTNHLIRSNICLNIGRSIAERRHAYYMDEHVRESRLEGNLAFDCPSPLHNHLATNNAIVNNIFIRHGDVRLAFYRCAGHRMERNLVWASGTIEVFRPEAVSVWTNNLFYSETGSVLGYPVAEYSPGEPKVLSIQGIETGEDPRLRVDKTGRVAWDKSSPAERIAIRPLDLRTSGKPAAW